MRHTVRLISFMSASSLPITAGIPSLSLGSYRHMRSTRRHAASTSSSRRVGSSRNSTTR
ncbi:hypothetical protein PF001_g24742 [Phytophthora fragariae]|uniref:Uncharacterized protein n=1 Tax=Phytophthora fragariae TaxID=53985 RepID=A0A6A3R1Z8_9STRA|nr:hypothetical protein PF006_g25802 [Phytophthora fragariae]KAE9279386.1 hypothetical protein PF001_g24742 [Phytophthora fragariae]